MYSRILRNVFSFSLFLFSFFTISQLGKHFFFSFSYLSGIRIDYLAPTIYFIDIISLPLIIYVLYEHILSLRANFYIAKQSTRRLVHRNDILLFGVIFLLILLIINFSFSLSKPLWLYGFARVLQFFLLYNFFSHFGNKKYTYSPIIWGLCIGACFELVLSLLQLSARHSIQGWWYYLGERSFSISTPGIAKAFFFGKEFLRPYGTFSHPNSLGGFYLLIYAFILTQKRISNQLLKGVILFTSSALVLLSFSRTAIAVYVLINLLYFSRNYFSCKLCFYAKICVALFLIFFMINISGDINSFQKRSDFFQKSLTIIKQKPFSGTGIGSYLIAQHRYPQRFSTFFEQPVHNIFILTVAQLGIPLSLLIFLYILKILYANMQRSFFLLPFICIFITGNVDHYWLTLQQNMLVLAVIFGILRARS